MDKIKCDNCGMSIPDMPEGTPANCLLCNNCYEESELQTTINKEDRFFQQEQEWQAERFKLLYEFIRALIAAKRTGWSLAELTRTFNETINNLKNEKPEYFAQD